jgi:hypothetical protein
VKLAVPVPTAMKTPEGFAPETSEKVAEPDVMGVPV